MHAVHLVGTIGQYGAKLSVTETAQPQTSFTLVREEAGSADASCKTFLPGTVLGNSAEEAAETLAAGDVVRVEEELRWRHWFDKRGESQGKLAVLAWSVEGVRCQPVGSISHTHHWARRRTPGRGQTARLQGRV
jgi:single-stranded DNA-binding protein